MEAKKIYEFWLENAYFDEKTKEELREIAGDEKEIEERFYKNLAFGTGGLRGIIGAGTNRMNIYTVRKATQGLANYIVKQGAEKKGAAIAYDSRNMSPEFAEETALCLAANGVKAYIFPSLKPTPMLSFALRELGCTAGIVITRRNITDIRCTGRTAPRLPRRRIRRLSAKSMQLPILGR